MTGRAHNLNTKAQRSRVWLPCVLLIASVLVGSSSAIAQENSDTGGGSAIGTITKQVLTDPTTYAPSAILYTSMKLDWNSSQPLFDRGFVEVNHRYTQSGRSMDTPVSFSEGNQRLLLHSLAVIPTSMANNALNRVIERSLKSRFPEKGKLWTTLAWIERIAFASYSSYVLSSPHFEQWQRNQDMLREVGR